MDAGLEVTNHGLGLAVADFGLVDVDIVLHPPYCYINGLSRVHMSEKPPSDGLKTRQISFEQILHKHPCNCAIGGQAVEDGTLEVLTGSHAGVDVKGVCVA
jgi:hypothetical protein